MNRQDKETILWKLSNTIASIDSHYKEPMIAPNGKAEGLCLSVRCLNCILKQLKKEWKLGGGL